MAERLVPLFTRIPVELKARLRTQVGYASVSAFVRGAIEARLDAEADTIPPTERNAGDGR